MSKRIEDVITDVLTDDTQKNALAFVAYLRACGVPLEASENYWEVKFQDECLCFLWINGSEEQPGPWTIWSDQETGTWTGSGDDDGAEECPVDERTREIAWANVNICGNCGGCEDHGKRRRVLGRNFDHLCKSAMAFTDPDNEALDCAKKMIAIRMKDILQGK